MSAAARATYWLAVEFAEIPPTEPADTAPGTVAETPIHPGAIRPGAYPAE